MGRPLPAELRLEYQLATGNPVHAVTAWLDGETVGSLSWSLFSGTVELIEVREEWRRHGIATAMWFYALRVAVERGVRHPRHSTQRSQLGDAWARTVGGWLPEGRMI